MTTITLDPQPDSPECIRIDATTAPRNALPSDDRPRLASEWKRTADGRMTCTWTLRDATRARLPDLSPEDSTSGLENCVRSTKDRIAIGGHDRFLVWILAASAAGSDHPRNGRGRLFSWSCDCVPVPVHHSRCP